MTRAIKHTMCGLKAGDQWIGHRGGSGTSAHRSFLPELRILAEGPWMSRLQTEGTWLGQLDPRIAMPSRTTESK